MPHPRLRSLDLVQPRSFSLFEPDLGSVNQLRFKIDLSERDDEALRGSAKVICVELEALRSKMHSRGFIANRQQQKIMDAVSTVAQVGPGKLGNPQHLWEPEMIRPFSFWEMSDRNRFYYR